MASPEPVSPRRELSGSLEAGAGAAPPSICLTPCGSPPGPQRPLCLLYGRPQDRLLLGSCDSVDSEAMVSVGEVGDLGTVRQPGSCQVIVT